MKNKVICILILIVIVTLCFCCGVYYFNGCCLECIFSDSFGLLSAIFSGLAFLGAIFTLYWQQQDSSKKSFETNFYKQIEFFLKLTDTLYYKSPDAADEYEGNGREIFKWFYEEKKNFINGRDDLFGLKEMLKNDSMYLYSEQDTNVFESYFNYLFNIYDYIDNSKIEAIKKHEYANQLTSLLTNYELLLVFYYVVSTRKYLSETKYNKLSRICVEYHVFQNLNTSYLADISHVYLIDKKAYLKVTH